LDGSAPSDHHDDIRQVVTAAELRMMTFEPVRYIVPQYVPEGITLQIGRPKIGKSWLALDLAVACASDRMVLGSLKPAHGDVLYLALEDGKRRLQSRLNKLISPFSGEWPNRLTLAAMGAWPRADQGGLEKIRAWCKSVTKPILVVIDTLERFRKPADGGRQLYASDTEAIGSLQKIAVEYGIAILVLHHDRKAEADDPFDTVSGTLGLTGAADTILILKRQYDGSVVLHARGRDIEESDTALRFDKTTCRWAIVGAASEVRRSAERKRVISALTEAGTSLSVREIMADAKLKRNAADVLLGRMAKDGEIERVDRGKYALPTQAAKVRQIGKKERSEAEAIVIAEENDDLSDLSEGELAPGAETVL
jgi:RecA-family ATPase